MIHVLNYLSCLFSKQWSVRLCAFFTTFTLVMTVLILSTDSIGGRHYIVFNSSSIWDFENSPQDSIGLSKLISNEYIFPPVTHPQLKNFTGKPSVQIFNIFRRKRFGVFMEYGSDGHGETEWLEKVLSWRGLLMQPHPELFVQLLKAERGRSHLAQVCISPSIYPKHAFFRYAAHNESLTAIPCFPLYSLMRAYNTSHLDLLTLNTVTAPLQVLRTLPIERVRIKVISISSSDTSNNTEHDNICCDPDLVNLLERWGYEPTTACEVLKQTCYFVCSRIYCPSLPTYT